MRTGRRPESDHYIWSIIIASISIGLVFDQFFVHSGLIYVKIMLAAVSYLVAAYLFAQTLVALLLALQIFLAVCSAFFQNERLFKLIKILFVTEIAIVTYTVHTVADCFVLAWYMIEAANTNSVPTFNGTALDRSYPSSLDVFVYLVEAFFVFWGQLYIRRLSRDQL